MTDTGADYIITGIETNTGIGRTIGGSGGDINGDGIDDIVIGAFLISGGGTNRGSVYVHYGKREIGVSQSSTTTGSADATLVGENDNDRLGKTVLSFDMNGDGYDDIAMAAPENDESTTNGGKVYVFYGSSSGISGTINASSFDIRMLGTTSGGELGEALEVGDINGDGYEDLIASEPYVTGGNTQSGKAFVYYGGSSVSKFQTDMTSNITIVGAQYYGHLGEEMSQLSRDVNGDGIEDMLIGAYGDGYQYGASEWARGKVFLYYGSGSLSSSLTEGMANFSMSGHVGNSYIGSDIAQAKEDKENINKKILY